MITLALLLPWLPQDPTVAERLREAHHEVVVEADVAQVEAALAATPDGRFPGLPSPTIVHDLREAGVDAIDSAREQLAAAGAQEQPVAELLAMVRRTWGFRVRPEPAPVRPDLQEFEKVCSHAHRDLIQALGSGRDLTIVAAELQAAIDQIRRSVQNLDDIRGDDVTLLRDRLARISKGDGAEIQALAERIVLTAIALDRDDFRDAMSRQPLKSGRSDGSVQGDVLMDRDTSFGRMVVGGPGRNSYDCSQIDVLVDVGGDDQYRGPAGGTGDLRRLAVVVDLDGNDVYEAENDALGSGTFGIGVLVDLRGDDVYHAWSRSVGFGLGGVGVFIDGGGDDLYELGDQSGGVGLAGTGLFVDLEGDDTQTAGVQAFGCGLPAGVGLFVDRAGDDVRKLGVVRKRVADSGDDAAGHTTTRDESEQQDVSFGFGAGAGALPHMSGGFGALIDLGGGADRYEASGLALGVGVRGGVGVFIEDGGDDVYVAGDVSLGAAYAHGLGVFRDEGGKDSYDAGHLSIGAASGQSLGLGCDLGGDDLYVAITPSFGAARRRAVGGFVDLAGVDRYELRRRAVDWQVLAAGDDAGAAIGVFLHLGGAVDAFVFDRFPSPENDRTRRVDGGTEEQPEHWVFIDR